MISMLIGMIVLASTENTPVLLIDITVMIVNILFTLVSLPVEFDTSKRALTWMDRMNITNT